MKIYTISSDEDMRGFGAALAKLCQAGDVILLKGGLGAGKTTLARGFIQAFLPGTDIPSPTYTLVQTYETPDVEIWHCDLYRLERPDDVLELGLLEAFEACLCLIEWPERLGDYVPEEAKEIEIDFDGAGRRVKLTGWNDVDIKT